MNLYQYGFGSQPHYVVARSFAEAEEAIKQEIGWASVIERIDCLGPYICIADGILQPEDEEVNP